MNNSTDFNSSCEEAQLFGIQVFSDHVETVQRYVTLGFNCLIFPFSIVLTSFVIFLIIKFKHLRVTTFMLALQVIIIDWANAVTLTPFIVSSAVSGQWVAGNGMCIVIATENQLLFLLRSWLMFVFVFDRFCAVFAPFRYNRNRKKVILTVWLTILVLNASCILLSLVMGCYGFNRIQWQCYPSVQIEHCPNFLFCNAYVIAINAIGQITGNFIPLIMYIVLFIKAKKVRNQLTPAGTVQVDGEQRKRDRRANLTFFTMFLVLFGVSFPPLVAYVITGSILPTLGVRPPTAMILISFSLEQLYVLLPIMDSIVILRNPGMRQAIKMLKNMLINRRNN